MKTKYAYICQSCGSQFLQWSGQCGECNAWNTLVQELQTTVVRNKSVGYAGTEATVTSLCEVKLETLDRFTSGLPELDRVLGGGIVPGSVVLMGGNPGIGKSTVLLQMLCYVSQHRKALYVSGEESLQQIALRAQRLNLIEKNILVLTETRVESILAHMQQHQPKILVIDSIQTMFTETLPAAPGSVGQVRETAAQLTRFAKQTGASIFLVGHVTKEGLLAGPRVLEHIVDTVLYFEGEADLRFRLIRAVKNRFGAVNELGVFAMTEKGLRPVAHPSAIFLSRTQQPMPGSIVTATWEGTRPLLIEVQALVDTSQAPRRITVGLDTNRLIMLLAIVHRHAGIVTQDQDVFINIVGGVRLVETSADVPVILAAISSLRNRALAQDLIAFGEIGLSGEIRPVPHGQERLRDALQHGFKRAIIPSGNAPKRKISGLDVQSVTDLSELLSVL